MTDILSYGFMQRALVTGVTVGLLCSALAFFVVLKRLSFIGVGISHSAFGGVALGVVLGWDPFVVAGLFATAVAVAIGFVSSRAHLHEDTVIGILFSSAMALGVVLISLSRQYQVDLFGYLFGNILAVSGRDLWMVAGAGAVVLLCLGLFFKELLFLSFDEEVARSSGVPVTFLSYMLLICLAVTVVVSIRVVGVILVEALLVIPAAVGYQMARGYRSMLVISCLAGVGAALTGLWLSFYWDLPSGATIVLCAAAFFFLALLFPRGR